jgi:CheY-like chemotaxis protein
MEAPDQTSEFSQHVRNALAHIYDLSFLETAPLGRWLIAPESERSLTRGQTLRNLLLAAIEALRPGPTVSQQGREWRSYLLLHHKYVDGMSQEELEEELMLSARQVQREQQKALQALAGVLWDRRLAEESLLHQQPAVADALDQELQRIDVRPEIRGLEEALRDAWLTVRPLADAQAVTVRWESSMAVAQVYADAGLLHQGLVSLFRSVLFGRRQEELSLRIEAGESEIAVLLGTMSARASFAAGHGTPAEALAGGEARAAEMLEVARRLLARNGGRLVIDITDRHQQWRLELPAARPYTLLVVDDNEAAIRLCERYLSGKEFSVIGATDGEQALELARAHRPAVIMLDLMMPRRDGWQILQAMHEESALASIPVIVCSVLEDHELARALGAAGGLQKPFSQAALLRTLRGLVQTAAAGPA